MLLVGLLVSFAVSALEINDANRAQLEQLSGVGVALADRILVEREKARFAGWDDLRKRVKGLSGKRVAEWQAQGVTVNGEGDRRTTTAPHHSAKSDREQGK